MVVMYVICWFVDPLESLRFLKTKVLGDLATLRENFLQLGIALSF